MTQENGDRPDRPRSGIKGVGDEWHCRINGTCAELTVPGTVVLSLTADGYRLVKVEKVYG